MIEVAFFRVHHDQLGRLRGWLRELTQRAERDPDDLRARGHPPRAGLALAHVLVKVLQTSVDDEKSFGVMSNPSLPVRRMGEPGLNRSMGPIPGRREGAQR